MTRSASSSTRPQISRRALLRGAAAGMLVGPPGPAHPPRQAGDSRTLRILIPEGSQANLGP
ncbi:MAG: hypothetical protein AAGG01_01745, partial [Planctomycetota bacterium]